MAIRVKSTCEILAVPIAKRELFFHVKQWKPPALNSDTLFSTTNEKKSLRIKIRSKIDEWVDKGSTYWETMGTNPENTIKKRIYNAGNYLMDRIDADEWFLKEISAPSKHCVVYYPSGIVDKSKVESRFEEMVRMRVPYHQRYKKLSIACIPLSIAMGIIPGPNVFLAYNIFRIYSHDKALTGNISSLLTELRGSGGLKVGALRLSSMNMVKEYVANGALEHILLDNQSHDTDNVLTDHAMNQLATTFAMPQYFLHDIKRTRKQYLLQLNSNKIN